MSNEMPNLLFERMNEIPISKHRNIGHSHFYSPQFQEYTVTKWKWITDWFWSQVQCFVQSEPLIFKCNNSNFEKKIKKLKK